MNACGPGAQQAIRETAYVAPQVGAHKPGGIDAENAERMPQLQPAPACVLRLA